MERNFSVSYLKCYLIIVLVIDYKVEGCYKDRKGKNDTIFTKKFNTVKGVDRKNPDVEKIFLECKEMAEKEGYEIFAIQVKVLIYTKYTATGSRKVVGKMCTRQSREVVWDMFNTLFLTL